MKYCDTPCYIGLANKLEANDNRHPVYEKQFYEQGFDDTTLWNLDIAIIRFIYPRLLEFTKYHAEYIEGSEFNKKLKNVLKQFETLHNNLDDINCNTDNKIKAFKDLAEIIPGLWY